MFDHLARALLCNRLRDLFFYNLILQPILGLKLYFTHDFRAAPGKGRMEFEVSLNGLFSAVVKMMLNGSNDALLVQVSVCYIRLQS